MPRSPHPKLKGFSNTGKRIFQLYMFAADRASSRQCDVLIEPVELADFGYLSHRRGQQMYQMGYEAAKKVLNDINKR